MRTKRGVIEVQFNWIFILIAGAVILLFFVSVVKRQTNISDEKIAVDIKTIFKAILVDAKQNIGTLSSIHIPKTEITYDCTGYSVKGTNPMILGESFSPSVLESVTRKLYLWALDWSIPYKTANFQYILSPDIRYIIVDDNNYAEELYNLLPENVTKELKDWSNIDTLKDKNNYNFKLVFFDESAEMPSLNFLEKMHDKDVTAINIVVSDECEPQFDSTLDGCGNITFYEKKEDIFEEQGTYPYIKKESLLGAVVADNNKTYVCVMERAMKKLNITAQIYLNRTLALEDYIESGNCKNYYIWAKNRLNKIMLKCGELSFENIKEIYQNAYTLNNNLKYANKKLQTESCPLIY